MDKSLIILLIAVGVIVAIISVIGIDAYITNLKVEQLKKELKRDYPNGPDFSYEKRKIQELENRLNLNK